MVHAVTESSGPGIAAGIVIAALVGRAGFDYLSPLLGKRSGIGWAFAALAVIWLVKTAALRWFSGYYFDVGQFSGWAQRIATVGPAHFYGPGYAYNDEFPPGGIYVLWPFGSIGRILGLSSENLRIVVETPPLLADLVTGVTMFAYLLRSGRSLTIAWAGMLLVALNPALLFNTVVWGQTDSVVTSLMWLTTVVALEGQYTLAAPVLALAVLVKPHALILIAPLACWALRKDGFARLWTPIGVFIATIVVAVIPFAAGRPWDWSARFYSQALASFRETSVNAFNFMAIVGGMRQPDTVAVFGVSEFALGIALVLVVLVLSCAKVWRNPSPRSLILAIFIALFGEFLFGPRMHERYLYPAIVFFAPTALEGLFWLTMFSLLTLNWLFNLAYVLHTLETIFWLPVRGAPAMLGGTLNLIIFVAVLSRITTLERDASLTEAQRSTLALESRGA